MDRIVQLKLHNEVMYKWLNIWEIIYLRKLIECFYYLEDMLLLKIPFYTSGPNFNAFSNKL